VSCLAALAIACSGDDAPPPAPSGPISADRFCAELARALCEARAACDCPFARFGDNGPRCTALYEMYCVGEILGDPAALDGARVIYDADAAGRVVAGFRATPSAGCASPFETLGWTLRDALTFGGVVRGTVGPGAACAPLGSDPELVATECREGRCQDGGCIGYAGRGASCDPATIVCRDLDSTTFDEAHFLRCDPASSTCGDLGAPGATCALPYECTTWCDTTSGTCAFKLADGVECTDRSRCESAWCAGSPAVCTATNANGVTCTSAFECTSGACVSGVCGPPQPDGTACRTSSECVSGYCGATSTCGPVPMIGEACASRSECSNGVCREGLCVPDLCALWYGD